MSIAICVCTYKRPEGIAKLLDSLSRMLVPEGGFSLFIADNDPIAHEGYNFIQENKHKYGYKIFCEIEPGMGICHARNKTLSMVKNSGMDFDFIAFTDDDVEVSPVWLRDLVRTASFYDADLVGAKLEPLFEKRPSDDVLNSSFFKDACPPTGTKIHTMGTHNVLIRKKVFDHIGYSPFDLNLSTFGGSDMEVATRIDRAGYKMTWCATAYVYETFPTERLNKEWIKNRYFRSGTSYAYIIKKQKGILALSYMSFKKVLLMPLRLARLLITKSPTSCKVFYTDLGFIYYIFKGLSRPEYKR